MVITASGSPPLNFIVPRCCFVPPFHHENLTFPLSAYLSLTGWLYFSRAPLTFLHSFECN